MGKLLFFFDIDDTLISEKDYTIPQSAIDAIREGQKLGHLMFINTGRCLQTVKTEVRELGFDGYVCGCGTSIYNAQEEIICGVSNPLPPKVLAEAAIANHVDLLMEGRTQCSFVSAAEPMTVSCRKHLEDYSARGLTICEYDDPSFSYDKFVIWINRDEDGIAFRKVSDHFFSFIDRQVYMGSRLFEFVPHGWSKASGIEWVCRHYGIPRERTYAFGDSNNDLPMFDAVGHAIAMGNCTSRELLSKASWVTGKASDNGLADALYRIYEENR